MVAPGLHAAAQRDRYGLDLKKVPFDFPELIAALAPRAFSPARRSMTPILRSRVCGRASMPRERSTNCERATDRLVAIFPDAEHSFPKAARLEAYQFLDRDSGDRPPRRASTVQNA